MKKSFIIVIIIVLFITALGIGVILLSPSKTPTVDDSITVPTKTFSPFSFITDIFSDDNGSSTDTESSDVATTTEDGGTSRSVYDILTLSPVLKVAEGPVAGATFVSLKNGTTTEEHLRYVERETGHMYDLVLDTNAKVRLSNTTIPRVQEALWGANGGLVVLRYLSDDKETIETYAATIATTSDTSTTLSGTFLPQNIDTITVSPFSPQVFYLLATKPGVAGRLYNAATGETRAVFSSPVSEWLAAWGTPTSVVLSTKPSYLSLGFAYVLNLGTGGTSRLLENTLALTTLPNSAGDILVGSLQSNTMTISRYDAGAKTLNRLAGGTLPEKCVWADAVSAVCALPETTSGSFPDVWYEGSVSFTDSVWKIDTQKNLTDFLFDASVTNEPFDAIYLSLNNTATLLSFINKKDGSLWIASLEL